MKTIIVARWLEDVSWVQDLPAGWTPRIVQKGVDIQNWGREPSSYLWAMADMYESTQPGDLLAFAQGDPFAHSKDLFGQLAQPVDGFTPLTGDLLYGDTSLRSDGEGRPHHFGLPVADCYRRWFGEPFPGEVEFWPGGQFVITGTDLRRRPVGFYRAVLDDVSADHMRVPWVLERLWPAMFNGKEG